MMSKPTAGIILAAGESKRFGQPKQLVKLNGKYLIEWVIDAALNSRLEQVILVLGYEHQKILQALEAKTKLSNLRVVINRQYWEGQSRSLRLGLLKARSVYPSVMFLLADQPKVDSKTIDHLLLQFWQSDKDICVPVHKGQRGNPTIFSQRMYNQLLEIQGDTGARGIIERHPKMLLEAEIEDPALFIDIDREEDLQNLNVLLK
jgi:molybdenum cofactor cytidylyltransferase